MGEFNVSRTVLLHLMTVLTVEGAVEADGWKWRSIPSNWRYDHDRAEMVAALRHEEQQEMADYAETANCRMAFLRGSLDDPYPPDCGCCDNCTRRSLAKDLDHQKVAHANHYLRHRYLPIRERKRWPDRSAIPGDRRLQGGKVLSRWADGGWGNLVKNGKQVEGQFDQQLVDAAIEMITEHWRPDPRPAWVTYVPSRRSPELVSEFAHRLATRLNLACHGVIEKSRETEPQKTMENGFQQYRNVKGAFTINGQVPDGPVLLVDDIVDSKWTLTEVGYRLLEAGSGPVFPFALASTAKGSI
jgi:ATP-dependent DNA helicase RecQ